MSDRAILWLFLVVVPVCFFGIIIPAQAGDGKPVASIEVDSHNFGFAYEGEDVTHDFIVKNSGDAALEIKTVKTH
ncbi:MAG: DUF1573 domain-containing protein [Desulfobacteraceae bacterium]|nr:MAG: DUF1573 domain-containing protein [Desulfobacteraceae bacterium]